MKKSIVALCCVAALIGCVTSNQSKEVYILKPGTTWTDADTVRNVIYETTYTVNPDNSMTIRRDTIVPEEN